MKFTDLCEGELVWLAKMTEIAKDFVNGNFGCSDVSPDIFFNIAKHRKLLYASWFHHSDNPLNIIGQ